MTSCGLCDIDPRTNKTFVKDYGLWTLLVNRKQPTLGSALLVLNRHVEWLPDLTDEEAVNYLHAARELEEKLKGVFKPDMVNHLMLANVVRHLHYQVVPRYSGEQKFANRYWRDPNYGGMPVLDVPVKQQRIIDAVKDVLR